MFHPHGFAPFITASRYSVVKSEALVLGLPVITWASSSSVMSRKSACPLLSFPLSAAVVFLYSCQKLPRKFIFSLNKRWNSLGSMPIFSQITSTMLLPVEAQTPGQPPDPTLGV